MIICLSCKCRAQPSHLRDLAVGDTAIYRVLAKVQHNKTGLRLKRGAVYQITAAGQWQDADFKPTDANGFKGFTRAMKIGQGLKPMPKQNYLKLLAAIGFSITPIGAENTLKPAQNGRLVFIPNDARFFFGNNSGSLLVTVKRVE
jgi:hypothetical protein